MFLNAFKNLFTSKTTNKLSKKGIRRRLELLGLEERVVPATFTVVNNSDSGAGSLRQAIIDANATVANDIIDFNFATGSSPYTITLAAALPNIVDASTAGTLTITGLGASSLTISGNQGNFRIFTIDTGGNLSISGVTVSGANNSNDGGAFTIQGSLSITSSTLSGNAANFGAGRFYNGGTVTVSNSTISGNTANNGGAIFNGGGGTLNLLGSTLSSNTANVTGGAIWNDSTINVTNSTLSGNSATSFGGGFYNQSPALSVSGATLNIANTIIANSTSGGDYAGGGTVNLISPSTAANNLVSQGSFSWATTKTSAEINLGTLANNGGPTQTLALLNGSAAIATANATVSNAAPVNGLDQRGVTRSSTAPSIGAYEYIAPVASKLGLTTSAAGSVNGVAFTTQPVITLQDSQGATATTNNSPVTMTVSSGATTLGTTTVNAVNGVATFTDVGISGTVGTAYTLTFASGSLTTATQSITPLDAANTPTFGAPIATADGFTSQITNYDSNFAYSGTATASGTVTIDSLGLVTVTGVAAGTSSLATITTTRTNYANGSAQVGSTSLLAANTPIFGTPASTADGFTVSISNYDSNFAYAGTATANGTVTIDSLGLVTVTGVAAGTSSTATITTTRTNYASGSAQVTATSLAAPNVISITPTSGSIAGGTTITITGTDFTGATAVTIGGVAATNLVVVSSTSITATTPAHAAGTASVEVTTPGGTNTANTLFTYVAALVAPTVTNISPTSGSTAGGTSITITGTDFTGATAVTIGGTAATNVVVVSSTSITATTPAGTAGTASVLVTTPGGTNSANTLFTYVAALVAPTVTSISPTSGSVAGGTSITITGTDFTGATAVTIGGTAATNVVVVSSTSITATTPAGTAGTASVEVTTPGGTNTANTLFTFVAAPTPTPTAPLVVGTPPPTSSSGSSTVTLYDPVTGAETGTAVPFPGFSGPIKVVSGDFNNDGIADIIAGAGFGGGPAIAILNSQTGQVMESFFAFDPAFTGGVFVAVQDVNGDGILDIIAGAGPTGGPEVRIFDGSTLNVLRSFYAYAVDFTGGVSVASTDFNNDGILDLVTGAGPGGAPHVKVFDGATNAIISQWYAYSTAFTGGVFVAAGDIGNDGNIEVVTGAGPGGSPVVAVWDPYPGALLAQFMAYAEDFTGGVRVGINDGNSDGIADILTGAGPGGGPQVNVFNFPALDLLFSFYSGDPANTGGIFVS